MEGLPHSSPSETEHEKGLEERGVNLPAVPFLLHQRAPPQPPPHPGPFSSFYKSRTHTTPLEYFEAMRQKLLLSSPDPVSNL